MDEFWDSETGVYLNGPVKVNNSGDNIENSINMFLEGGAPASKLNMGVPFFGKTYQLADPSRTEPGSPFIAGLQQHDVNIPPYNENCQKFQNSAWIKNRDAYTLSPYMYSGNLWITYEDEQSIFDKANLAIQYNLAGVMCWSLYHDDYDGVCSSCKWPLLKALNSAIGRATACSDLNQEVTEKI